MDPSQPPSTDMPAAPGTWLLWALYVFFVLCTCYFSVAETSLSSANHIRIRSAADEGSRNARILCAILDRFEKTLTAILVGTNIASLGCASVATLLVRATFIGRDENTVAAIATAFTTVVIFLIGEIIPKSYAQDNADRAALSIAPSLRVFTVLLTPLTFLFSGISAVMAKLMHAEEEPTVTEEEISDLIETIGEEGVIDEEQSDLLQSALEFSKTTVADVLTIRQDIAFIDVNTPADTVAEFIISCNHSRLPVVDGDLDHVVGVLVIRDFLKRYVKDTAQKVADIMKPAFFVSLGASIDDLLTEMSRNRFYMAIVRDPAGNTVGMVTIEDFLEELVGEIFDEDDVIDENFMKLGGQHFDVSGDCPMGEMFRRMAYTSPAPVSPKKTLHVWLLEQLGHVPAEEEEFVWHDLTFSVEEMEDGHVCRVEVALDTPELDVSDYPEAPEAASVTEGREV